MAHILAKPGAAARCSAPPCRRGFSCAQSGMQGRAGWLLRDSAQLAHLVLQLKPLAAPPCSPFWAGQPRAHRQHWRPAHRHGAGGWRRAGGGAAEEHQGAARRAVSAALPGRAAACCRSHLRCWGCPDCRRVDIGWVAALRDLRTAPVENVLVDGRTGRTPPHPLPAASRPHPLCRITGFFDVAPAGDPNSLSTSALPRVPTLDGSRIGPPQILEDWEIELQPKSGGGWFGGGSGPEGDDVSVLRSLQRGDK